MSTCPEMELYSAYIDGEIASPWADEIKSHIDTCAECKSHVDTLQSVRSAFAADSASLTLSEKQLDESFDRLQSRLRFTKVSSKTRVVYADFAKKLIPYAAAAVFLGLVILPSASVRSQVQQHFSSVALVQPASSAELINKTGIAGDENITASTLKVSNSSNAAKKSAVTPVALHVSNLTKVDVFKPELSNETNPINIKLIDITEFPLIEPEVQSSVYPAADFYR